MSGPSLPPPLERGPYPVGLRQIELCSSDDPSRSLPTDVWYPAAAAEADGPMAGPMAPHPFGRPHHAWPDLAPIDSPCPLIVFSHGNAGLRQQSTFLTTHLASRGHVVAAPDHTGNTFTEMAALPSDEARREAHRRIRDHRPADLLRVLAALLDERALASWLPPLDPQRVGALGHSFGGWTALKLPRREPRIRAVCALAPASEAFVGRRAFDAGELPLPGRVSTLLLAARDDVLVDLETSIRPLHARLGASARLEVIDDADHFHFCDGIEMLHAMHENTPRPGVLRATRPWRELLDEETMHGRLSDRVSGFFETALRGAEERP